MVGQPTPAKVPLRNQCFSSFARGEDRYTTKSIGKVAAPRSLFAGPLYNFGVVRPPMFLLVASLRSRRWYDFIGTWNVKRGQNPSATRGYIESVGIDRCRIGQNDERAYPTPRSSFAFPSLPSVADEGEIIEGSASVPRIHDEK